MPFKSRMFCALLLYHSRFDERLWSMFGVVHTLESERHDNQDGISQSTTVLGATCMGLCMFLHHTDDDAEDHLRGAE